MTNPMVVAMDDFKDLADWDENTVALSVGKRHRVILNTMHGQIIIDVRADDVNAFVIDKGGRKDFVLLKRDDSKAGASRG